MTTSQWIKPFQDGNASQRETLGGKGANLSEMLRLGIPVPPGFTIITDACAAYSEAGYQFLEELKDDISAAVSALEEEAGRRLGESADPLLVSVRSGAAVSMPGMMDTVLNLGLNDRSVEGLAASTNSPRFAWDCYRRFIQMYGDVVLGISHSLFEDALSNARDVAGAKADTDLTYADLKSLTEKYKAIVRAQTGTDFPQDPMEQLDHAIAAVFRSWMSDRAITYRRINRITELKGTAVNVQAMVFGNLGETSGTGVIFTRNPGTGEKGLFGEYLANAQGEDVVAGIRTPKPIEALKTDMPAVYEELERLSTTLETHGRDVQDIEFTVERGALYLLQTRSGKRTARAAVRIATDMVEEGLISQAEALQRIDPLQLDQLLHPMIDPKAKRNIIATGLPASPGGVSGYAVFTADEAERQANLGRKVILVRRETSPEDIHGMHAAEGILTAHGGMTSHAAVVARGMGKACVCGVNDISVHAGDRYFTAKNGVKITDADIITLDGTKGEVLAGEVETIAPTLEEGAERLLTWADETRVLGVRANADTPEDAARARKFGAEGIGLCRTEHMFFDPDRILAMREMILAPTTQDREAALKKILPYQRSDFEGILRAMDGLPVTIRLLDPPLHEFLPHSDSEQQALADSLGVSIETVKQRVHTLSESNPMMGLRGCRLTLSYPEIAAMQARAVFEATACLIKEGLSPRPEIMAPLVSLAGEYRALDSIVRDIAATVEAEAKITLPFEVGVMIETPRACVRAEDIAQTAEFFSFGTNDLTQFSFGFSRDDLGSLIQAYQRQGFLGPDPFSEIDRPGVGELVRLGAERGKSMRPDIKTGICGEHGGDPESIEFCHMIGLTYVSCSPWRAPIARLAAARAALKEEYGSAAHTTVEAAKE